ncbi:MAG TPA: GNAT family N-acetyltransferase [Acidimicrobiales bacterium]|nr:GNAT family N-acetyltransferase [Acidimicrobiales bacterium]
MSAESVRVRAAERADAEGIRELLGTSFSGNPKGRADVMDWQYWHNPFGAARAWVAEAEGRIVAHYAGICLPGVLEGSPVTLAMGVDAATDPGWRGLGLFEQLARAVYLDCGQAGMPVTYCLPNPNSLRGFQKAGGRDVGRARVLVAALDDAWLAERIRMPRPLAAGLARAVFRRPRPGEADVVTAPPEGLDGLWHALAPRWRFGVARGADWWRWRYTERPDRPYVFAARRRAGRLVAAAAAMVREDLGGRFLCLLELMAEDRADARDVVGALVAQSEILGTVALAGTALPGTWHHRMLRASGLRTLPRRYEPQPMHVGLADNAGTMPPGAVRGWSLCWGDLDHL